MSVPLREPAVISVRRYRVRRYGPDAEARPPVDDVAIEQPVELRVAGAPTTVTMRTPGDDIDLALGWLVSEGCVRAAADVLSVRERAMGEDDERAASVEVTLAPGVPAPLARAYPVTSACGVCGSDAADAVLARSGWPVAGVAPQVDPEVLATLPERLARDQATFARTGGLHAAGLFRLDGGDTVVVREDVGRHNAVDKVVGVALREGLLPAADCALQVSGRASFELVQKAVMAGIPVLAAVSAPSSLAVELARSAGLTLVGFVRDGSFTVYAGEERFADYPGREDRSPAGGTSPAGGAT
ncbi:MAG: formate dehydrogenase accessory sulfurtransferase FdhD [Candidatus Nanopelagicales bacterium]